ncbi:helix-turn-helix domain-containing protein [Psychromarinibacter sp. S121]|uniref:helix-turn-helix domain-containing protein n=1 Tax=Psychromarinibacter sp. S121 TaxID=3415127 RepID=UPI003C7DFCFE
MAEDSAPEENGGWYSNESATFGDRLVAARDALGLSQADLARQIGVKLKTLSAWENDLSEPRANKLQMLAGVLNVSLIWLLNGEGDGIDNPDSTAMPEELSALLTEIRTLKGNLKQTADRLGGIEKRLQKALRDQL